jgi:choline-glycine betaine transporter
MLIIFCCVVIYIASVFLCRWIIILDVKSMCDKDNKNVKKICNYLVEDELKLILFPIINLVICITIFISLFLEYLIKLRFFIFLKKPLLSFINWFLCK